MKKTILLFTYILFTIPFLNAQEVKNVNFEVNNNVINIDYKLTGSKYINLFDVSVYVSLDGGSTFQGPLQSVSGDVGKGVKSGLNQITWDFYKDVTALEGSMVFKVIAEVKNQKSFFIHYTGSYSLRNVNFSAPFGLTIGQLSKIGWYASARINTNAFTNSQYDFDGTNILNYNDLLYYESDDNYKYPSFEAYAGITKHIFWNIFFYGGVGYSYQKYYGHINEYSYETNNLQSNSYIDYIDYSESGIAAEGGIILKANTISFNIGYSTLKFSYSNVIFGLGFNF